MSTKTPSVLDVFLSSPSNFSNYRARFSMPNYQDTESFFYSWNMGPVHFISVNTEAYYFLEYGLKPLSRQYEWLINDLEVWNYFQFAALVIIVYCIDLT